MRIDIGKLSQNSRALALRQGLLVYGLDCRVTHAANYSNTYEQVMAESEIIYPDEQSPEPPSNQLTCRILIDEPVEGLLMDNDAISLSDKVETQFTITTDVELQMEDRLEVTFPDGKLIHFRITERMSKHPFTTVGNKYKGVVV